MSSAAILCLEKEVAALADVPLGPERAAACNRPRRQCWDALASIQRSLRPIASVPRGRLSEGWQQDLVIEARECCKDLRGLVCTLEQHDRESGDSHWASTEYTVLEEEIDLLSSQISELLGEEVKANVGAGASGDEVPAEVTSVIEAPAGKQIPKGVSIATMATLTPGSTADVQSPFAGMSDEVVEGEGAIMDGEVPSVQALLPSAAADRVARRPVRLTVEDLQEEYDHPNCKWALDGTCENGCTVGGCAHLVEAW